MKWSKTSKYSIESGSYSISRCIVKSKEIFTLWKVTVPKEVVGYFTNADDAKAVATNFNHVSKLLSQHRGKHWSSLREVIEA